MCWFSSEVLLHSLSRLLFLLLLPRSPDILVVPHMVESPNIELAFGRWKLACFAAAVDVKATKKIGYWLWEDYGGSLATHNLQPVFVDKVREVRFLAGGVNVMKPKAI